jgi:hypothetical protein
MAKDLFLPKSPLTKIQRKYCTCLVDVRDKSKGKVNPYAVCTKSIYTTRGLSRNTQVGCDSNYNYDKMSEASLIGIAKEKSISLKNKKNKKASKKLLASRLSGRIQVIKTKKYKLLKKQLDELKSKKKSKKSQKSKK